MTTRRRIIDWSSVWTYVVGAAIVGIAGFILVEIYQSDWFQDGWQSLVKLVLGDDEPLTGPAALQELFGNSGENQ